MLLDEGIILDDEEQPDLIDEATVAFIAEMLAEDEDFVDLDDDALLLMAAEMVESGEAQLF